MVYKVSIGGVRSGNTLRGLHSYRTRRYYRQACIIGRCNIKPNEVPTFLDSHIKDKQISSCLGTTNIALSLNKKKRWLLPATVGHMIKTGSFNDEKTMVSLLERHKLKRRANCVSFVCNQGRIRHVAPRQKRYFSFKLDNIDSTLSNRQRKRQQFETMKRHMSTTKRPVKLRAGPFIKERKETSKVKTMEVFTSSGTGDIADVGKFLVSSKPEYRMEVFYPCPRTCSLTYNPKYTNVHMEFDEEGGMELKSEKKVLRKGRRHRRRVTLKEFKDIDLEVVSSDTEDFWDGDSDGCQNEAESDQEENDDDKNFESYALKVQGNDSVIASLIMQAEKARSLCENSKTPRRRKRSNKVSSDHNCASNMFDKSHIVYINEVEAKHSIKSPITPQASTATTYVTLHSAKIILKSVDCSPAHLRAKFGRFYAEAESEPRRFVIDVTEDVQNLVCPSPDAELSSLFTSFLVFVHDGVYDEGLDTFKVIFNSNCCPETEAFKNKIPFGETSIAEVMDRVVSTLVGLKKQSLLALNYSQFVRNASAPRINCISDLVKASVATFHACDEIRRVSQTEIMQENVDFGSRLENIVNILDYEIFCDICYENVNPTQTWDVCGTKLSKCSHIFCDDCWRSHLRARLMDGAVKMTCPGYDCDETVGPVTMLSLLHVSEVSKFFQRKCEQEADSSSNSRWCPNRACGRVIKLAVDKSANDMSLDVTCSCGVEFCFSCLSHPHWPATCEQAEKYDEKVQIFGSMEKSTDDAETVKKIDPNPEDAATADLQTNNKIRVGVLEVEGRLCPKCSKFMENDGGCPVISCKCGYNFCWICMQDWKTYKELLQFHKVCKPTVSKIFEATLRLKFRHHIIPTVFSLSQGDTKKTKAGEPPQKTTLYKKAFQERQEVQEIKNTNQIKEMAKQAAHVSRKDLNLKRMLLSNCGLEIDDNDTDKLIGSQVMPHVSKFLRSCCEIKRALHHVAEFTFVLLQDTADSVDKRRALRLANDLSGYCSFIRSILEAGQRQDMGAAVKRLADIQVWAKRALAVLLVTVNRLRR